VENKKQMPDLLTYCVLSWPEAQRKSRRSLEPSDVAIGTKSWQHQTIMSSSKVARDICQATNQKKLVEILINLSNFVSMMLVINRGRYERSSRMA